MIYRVAIIVTVAAISVRAQDRVRRVEVHTTQSGAGTHWTSADGPAVAFAPQAATYRFMAAESHFDSRVVKGAPFAGDGVTEFTQTLADGTRIHRESTSKMARDSEGRTRHEQQAEVFGTVASSSAGPRIISINDPVAQVIYHLNDRDKTAQKIERYKLIFDKLGAESATLKAEAEKLANKIKEKEKAIAVVSEDVTVSRAGTFDVAIAAAPGMMARRSVSAVFRSGDVKTESLGKQTIEGVVVEGTRETSTLETGAIGNDRPLVTTTERWYSPELQTVVLSRTNDPVSGETVYRLTNLRRGEPDKRLFEVPADYTIDEGSSDRHFLKVFPKPVEK